MGITKHVFEDFRAIPILGDIAPRAILCSLALCCFSLFSNYCQPSNLTACLFTCLPIGLPACLSTSLHARSPFHPPVIPVIVCLHASLLGYLSTCLIACMPCLSGYRPYRLIYKSQVTRCAECDILCSLPTDIEDPFQVFFQPKIIVIG